MAAAQRTIFHIDMDAFFASVEQRDFPAYRNKPVIVGSKVGTRGVVSAASYEARRFGVHSALPINEAYRRCPQGIFVRPRMAVYEEVSSTIMELFARYSPLIEQISVDEAFLDMTGTEKLLGTPQHTAETVKQAIKAETGLTASIGVAPNKFCAKIASDMNKPNGITMCPFTAEAVVQWLAPMPVLRIWGVGKQTAATLNSMGIEVIGDLQQLKPEMLTRRFGKNGAHLYSLSRGIDARPVSPAEASKSISREHTFPADTADRSLWQSTLFTISQDIARRARQSRVKGSTIFLTYRLPDFTRHTRQKILRPPTNVARFIFEEGKRLLEDVDVPKLRLIGLGITGLDQPLQIDLFDESAPQIQWEQSEKAIDQLTERYGAAIIRKARELGTGNREKSQ